jgi:hypothetical protein
MVFQAEKNCGYSVNPIAPTAERFSVAVIYRSRNCDGRTLCSIAGKSHDNFIFANEFQGKLSIIDRAGTIGLLFSRLIQCTGPVCWFFLLIQAVCAPP